MSGSVELWIVISSVLVHNLERVESSKAHTLVIGHLNLSLDNPKSVRVILKVELASYHKDSGKVT